MTVKQDKLYWREWAAVHRAAPEADRHALHIRALGHDKSHLHFTNTDFDRVLAGFRAISQPANLLAQMRQFNQPKTRLLWRIRSMAPPNYTAAIARDKFGTTDLESLDESQLNMLRNTLAARSNALRRKEPELDPANAPF